MALVDHMIGPLGSGDRGHDNLPRLRPYADPAAAPPRLVRGRGGRAHARWAGGCLRALTTHATAGGRADPGLPDRRGRLSADASRRRRSEGPTCRPLASRRGSRGRSAPASSGGSSIPAASATTRPRADRTSQPAPRGRPMCRAEARVPRSYLACRPPIRSAGDRRPTVTPRRTSFGRATPDLCWRPAG
jgi:hypothetical protein